MPENKKNNKLNESLELLINYISDPALLIDFEGRLVCINKATTKYSEYEIEKQIGKHLNELDFFTEESKRLLEKNFKARLAGKNVPAYEVKTIPKKQGDPLCLEVKGNLIKDNGEAFDLVILNDVTERSKNQEALERGLIESEERSQGIINAIKESIILVDEDAKVVYWNPAAQKTFGYTIKEALGKKIHELIAPKNMYKEAQERIETSLKIFSETGVGYFTVGNVQLTGCRKDGSEFPVELSLSPLSINGKWNAVGVVKDITARRLFECKLREAEQRYHTLFNQAPLGVVIVDAEKASFIEFNDVAHQQLGYTREEFEKLTVLDISAESPEQVKTHIKQLLESGGGEFENEHRTKDGTNRNVIVTVKPFESGGKKYLHGIFHDVTENKQTQIALVDSESRYRQLVEVAHEGIWAINNDFNTVFVNPRMAQMMGYAESEMVGKSLFDFVDPHMVETVRRVIKEFKVKQVKGHYEYAFPRKDGRRVDTNVTMSKISDDQGNMIGILSVVTDITERKRIEKALKESEELSRAIVANAPIGIATSDTDYHFLSANEAFCKILGYTEQELRNLTFREVTHPDDVEESMQKIASLEKGEIQMFSEEKRYIKKDGAPIVGRVIINALRDNSGKPVLFIVELEDVTKRRQLEDDVRASEEKFRAISSSATDAIILSNVEDDIIYWNPAAEKIIGFTQKEAIGKKLTELVIPPRAHQKHQAMLEEITKNPTTRAHFNFYAFRKNGSKFPIDLSVVPLKLNDKNCFLSVVRDITEWKAMEDALRQERDMLENMAANIEAGLTIVNRDYRILWANKLMKKIYKDNSLENSHCYNIYNQGACKICEGCGVKKIFKEEVTVFRRDFHVQRDGRDRWVELISTPVKDKEGKVVAALELSIDITERKLLQNKLADYSQRLEDLVQQRTEQLKETQAELVKSERLAAIGELAGMVGHDLRNPLTGIKNSAYFLKKKGAEISKEQAREMLETIDKCVDYSNRIVNDLLDYSREIHLELKEESLTRQLKESLSLIDVPSNIEIVNAIEDNQAMKVDPNKIKRLFINLIKNAIDAMPDGGKITIASRQINDYLEVSVTDTGQGISEDVLPKLFSPLCTTKAQGMGFGLAICRRIIEAHGGKISVKTSQGKGTTFTVTLPTAKKNEDGGEKIWINLPESSLSTTTKPSEQR